MFSEFMKQYYAIQKDCANIYVKLSLISVIKKDASIDAPFGFFIDNFFKCSD